MAAKKGFSKKTISTNISEGKGAGKSTKQAVASSLNMARTAAKKAGKPWKGPAKPGPGKGSPAAKNGAKKAAAKKKAAPFKKKAQGK